MATGSGEDRGPPTGVKPGALTDLLRHVAAAPAGPETEAPRLLPGAVIGRFETLRELGRGGFGVVYEARDRELGRQVALKLVRAGRADLEEGKVLREAEAIARLAHPNLITLHDVGRSEHGPYLVFELLRGRTLQVRLDDGPMPIQEAVHVAVEVARGLAHAHGEGVIHRDLKPANVFVTTKGQVKILDFGMAHAFGRRRLSGGTPAYMAPEQWTDEPEDERTDVFALGVMLHVMLSGEYPFPEDGGRWSAGAATAPRLELPGAPGLAELVARMLEKAAKGRPRDGAAVLAALAPIEEALRSKPADGRPPEHASKRKATLGERVAGLRRRRGLQVTAAMALVAALSGIGWYLWKQPSGREQAAARLADADGRISIAVADFANETGEKELDSISGLLITALEQSTQLRVLTRSRMFDVLRQLGKERVDRIDETLAREVGLQTGTRALLLATIRRLGESYVVDMRALDPQKDEYLFTVRDRASRKEAIFDMVDRLGEFCRQKLAAAKAPELANQRSVASITTASVVAWDQLSRARQATDHRNISEARKLAQAALETDPEFALAHYQLAMLAVWGEVKAGDMPRVFAAAEQRAGRHPEKERLLLRAIVAFEEGRFAETSRLRDQLAAAYPLDKEVVFYAGDVRFHTGQPAEAIPYFVRALQLDPAYGLCGYHLAEALANTVLGDQHLDWLRREAAATTDADLLRALARALLAAGQELEAVATFQRAAKIDGGPWPTPMYASYLAFHGKATEAEPGLRGELARLSRSTGEGASGFSVGARKGLQWILVSQGRLAEAGTLDGEVGLPEEPAASLRLRSAALARSSGVLRVAAEELALGAPWPLHENQFFVWWAIGDLAHAGDVASAARLVEKARAVPAWEKGDPTLRRILESIHAWGNGNQALAEEGLRATAALSDLGWRYLGLLLLGDLEQERGDCAAAVASWEQVRTMRWSPATIEQWFWTYPGMLHSLALCHERSGDLAMARDRNDELLRRWARADADLPLLIEAKAMKARLASPSR